MAKTFAMKLTHTLNIKTHNFLNQQLNPSFKTNYKKPS